MKQFDVVRLIRDVPDGKIQKGMTGVIIEVLTSPILAYEVEFSNENGETIAEVALEPDYLELIAPA